MLGWADYAKREPFGFPAADLRHGMLCAIVAASAGAEVAPSKFMLGKLPEDVEEDPSEQILKLLGLRRPPPGEAPPAPAPALPGPPAVASTG